MGKNLQKQECEKINCSEIQGPCARTPKENQETLPPKKGFTIETYGNLTSKVPKGYKGLKKDQSIVFDANNQTIQTDSSQIEYHKEATKLLQKKAENVKKTQKYR